MINYIQQSVSWLINPTRGQQLGDISGVFPDNFDRYYKIYLPFAYAKDFPEDTYPHLPDSIEEINRRAAIGKTFFYPTQWEKIKSDYLQPIYLHELAVLYKIPFTNQLSIQDIYKQIGKKPIQIQRSLSYEQETLKTLVQFLGENTKVRLFDYANFQLTRLGDKYKQDWLEKIPLYKWTEAYRLQNTLLNQPFPYFSAYLFEKWRKWAIAPGGQIGGHFLLIALSHELGEQLETVDSLVVQRLEDGKY